MEGRNYRWSRPSSTTTDIITNFTAADATISTTNVTYYSQEEFK